MPVSIPQEIHNLIVDRAAEDEDVSINRQTLWACACASRVLHHRAYHHLFSYIHINLDLSSTNTWECESALSDFIQLLRSSLRCPDVSIARYLREFELSIRPPDEPKEMQPALTAISYSLSELLRAVYSFTRVEYFKFSAVNCTLSLEKEEDGIYPVSEDLVNLCHSPTLSKLAMSNFTGVSTSLLRDSRIKQIDMSNISFSTYSRELRKFMHQPKSITVDGTSFRSVVNGLHGGGGPISSYVRCQEAFSHLCMLELRINGVDDLPNYLKMVAAASNTLDTLYLHIIADTSTIGPLLRTSSGIPKFFFHCITNLATLRISLYHNLTQEEHSYRLCFIKPLRYFLNVSTFPKSLQTLDIGAKTSVRINKSYEIECDCKPTTQTAHWGLLDEALTNPLIETIPHLQLYIKFCVESFEGFNEDTFNTQTCKAIAKVLPEFRNTRLFPVKGQLYVISDGRDSNSLEFMVPIP